MKSFFRHSWQILGISLTILALTAPAFAKTRHHKAASAPQGPTAQEYQQRLDELEQKEKILERNLELKDEQEKEKAKEKPVVKIGPDGISIGSADGNNEIRFRGLLQVDGRFYPGRDGFGPTDTFLLRRVWPFISGKFAKRFEFMIKPEFTQDKVSILDAYIDTTVFPEFKFRFGKFKGPVGLERLEEVAYTHFVERGLPTNLVPNRDLGAQVFGSVLDGVFTYQLGVFNGIFDGGTSDFDLNNGKDFEGRVFAQPFKKTKVEAAQGLGFGVAGTFGAQTGDVKNPQLPTYKTAGQRNFFSYLNDGTAAGTVIASDHRWRLSPQLYYYYKGFGLLGEYVLSAQDVAINGGPSVELRNQAWQAQLSYVIGADNSYGRIVPRNPLGWKKGGTGAFEFKARYNELHVDPNAFPTFADPNKSARVAKGFGVGFTWHINQNVKFEVDYDRTTFKGGAKGGDQHPENAILNQYQFYF